MESFVSMFSINWTENWLLVFSTNGLFFSFNETLSELKQPVAAIRSRSDNLVKLNPEIPIEFDEKLAAFLSAGRKNLPLFCVNGCLVDT